LFVYCILGLALSACETLPCSAVGDAIQVFTVIVLQMVEQRTLSVNEDILHPSLVKGAFDVQELLPHSVWLHYFVKALDNLLACAELAKPSY